MSGWQWFWAVVGFVAFIIVALFLFYYPPFENLFVRVINGISFSNIIFWVALIVGIVGFCLYHWQAYRLHIVKHHSVESMVLSSLRGSTFTGILLSGGATLQSVQILCVHLLGDGQIISAELGKRLGAMVALVILTAIFCVIFWLLKGVRFEGQEN